MDTRGSVRARGIALGLGFASLLTVSQLAMSGNGTTPFPGVKHLVPGSSSAVRPVQSAAASSGQDVAPLPSVPPTAAVATTVQAATTIPVATTVPASAPPPPLVVPKDPSEWFNPRGANAGTEGIITDLAKLGIANNSPLYVNECWGRTWGAATSDHHASQTTSWACDISIAGVQVPTPQADEAARRIASALGVQDWKGGNLVKYINGYRIQVLWRVADHFNHVHIGARKL